MDRLNGKLFEYYQNGKLQSESFWNGSDMKYLIEYDQEGRVVKSYGVKL